MGRRKQLAPGWAACEALYIVDPGGHERSAHLWPFAPRSVTMDLRPLAPGRGA